jgi:hypothetical protein
MISDCEIAAPDDRGVALIGDLQAASRLAAIRGEIRWHLHHSPCYYLSYYSTERELPRSER